ncbi:MAG: hypothetical protein WBA51_10860 [Erythrobacter sp.]
MDWEIILKGSGVVAFGLLFIVLGIIGWRHRREERINLIEAALLKLGDDDEPSPFSRWDRAMAYIQPVLMLIFGPLMVIGGIGILTLLGE